MTGRVFRRIALLLFLAGAAATVRAGMPGATGVYLCAAAAVLLALPGFWTATCFRPDDSLASRIALGFCAWHGVFALLALLFHALGLSLNVLLSTVAVFALAAAFLPGGADTSRRNYREAAVILVGGVILASVAGARIGFRTDAYDHLGGARWMIERGDVLPHEYFHSDRMGELDPRKGTNNTFFALLSLATNVDPVEAWDGFRLFHIFILLAAFHMLAKAALPGGVAPWAATLIFTLFYRGGPGGQWFTTAGYPGSAGYIVFLVTMAIALSAARQRENYRAGLPVLLGLAASGIHIFHTVLTALALGTLLATFLLVSRFRPHAARLIRTMALFAAGSAPLLLFRILAAYDPVNPLHIHPQGIFFLPAGMAILDYQELAHSFGVAGWLSLILLPFVRSHGRPVEPGEAFLAAAWMVTLFLVANPILFPILEERLGYLMRRLPLLIPWPLITGAIVARLFTEKLTPRVALPAVLAVASVLVSFNSSLAGWGRESYFQPFDDPDGEQFAGALRELDSALPAGSTVLTDPVTGYLLYGRTLLLPVAVIDQHSSPNDPRGGERIIDSQRALHPRWGAEEGVETLDRYGVEYVLINERYKHRFNTWNAHINPDVIRAGRLMFDALPDRFHPLPAPEGMHLYQVVHQPGTDGDVEREMAEFPEGTRLNHEMSEGISLVTSSIDRTMAKAGEKVTITTAWLASGEDDHFIPLKFVLRGIPAGAERRGWGKPWLVRPLGGSALPYILWKEGDRVVVPDTFRVPEECPPGEYILLLKVEPFSFFRVRAFEELGPWADLSSWVEVARLEVQP